MTGLDLRPYVSRSRALVDATPPSTRRETRTWLVEPFLETLGWDVRGEDCRPNATVDGTAFEYVCAVDGVPALFVAVESVQAELDADRAGEVLEAMVWSGVDRAIYANGRDFLFLAGTADGERLRCDLRSLPAHADSIAHFARPALERHLEDDPRARTARRLALERSTLVDAIVDHLHPFADDADALDEFEAAAERFLDQLVVSFATNQPQVPARSDDVALEFTDSTTVTDAAASGSPTASDGSDPAADADDPRSSPRSSADAGDRTDGVGDPSADASPAATDDANEDPAAAIDEPRHDPDTDDGGEYVVRFFADRGSVGAIGGSSSRTALVHAAGYLLERGLASVDVPWGPDDGPVVLNDEPTRADGSPMDAPQRLPNGYVLETAGDVATHAQRVESLAARAGFRVMLTGDWEDDDGAEN